MGTTLIIPTKEISTARLINSLRVLLNEDFRWKKPPKFPLSGGLATSVVKKGFLSEHTNWYL